MLKDASGLNTFPPNRKIYLSLNIVTPNDYLAWVKGAKSVHVSFSIEYTSQLAKV